MWRGATCWNPSVALLHYRSPSPVALLSQLAMWQNPVGRDPLVSLLTGLPHSLSRLVGTFFLDYLPSQGFLWLA